MPQQFNISNYPELLWNPTSLGDFTSIIRRKISHTSSDSREYVLVKNIWYNLQYLEFLLRLSAVESWHSVLFTQNIKSIVIISAGILEAILYHIIVTNRLNLSTKKIVPNSKKSFQCSDIRPWLSVEMVYFDTVPEYEDQVSFDTLIKKTESGRLLWTDHTIYASIKKIQRLRNKVHIHIGNSSWDTDYNSFGSTELNECKAALHKVLIEYFDAHGNSAFNFLL